MLSAESCEPLDFRLPVGRIQVEMVALMCFGSEDAMVIASWGPDPSRGISSVQSSDGSLRGR
jgi:hypothetical protein